MPERKKVAVAMSGGVDSSFAAYLLLRRNYDLLGVTFRIPFIASGNIEKAAYVCSKLGIPHEVIDVSEVFAEEVIDYFVSSYLKGLTPNPCVVCNMKIKFGFLYETVKRKGYTYIATGHYCGLIRTGGEVFLTRNSGKIKSQEYFLALVDKDILKHVIFPLDGYTKEDVLSRIKDVGIYPFPVRESQEVCFVGGMRYGEFLAAHIKNDRNKYVGFIRYRDGRILGEHKGFYLFTYGQREGLGISWKEPLYVMDIDASCADVWVAEKEFAFKDSFYVQDINWLYYPSKYDDLCVRIRYNSRPLPCRLDHVGEKEVRCVLKHERDIPAPGQIAVFYEGERVVAGGVIVRDERKETRKT